MIFRVALSHAHIKFLDSYVGNFPLFALLTQTLHGEFCDFAEDSELSCEEFAAPEGICRSLPDYAIASEEIVLRLLPGKVIST